MATPRAIARRPTRGTASRRSGTGLTAVTCSPRVRARGPGDRRWPPSIASRSARAAPSPHPLESPGSPRAHGHRRRSDTRWACRPGRTPGDSGLSDRGRPRTRRVGPPGTRARPPDLHRGSRRSPRVRALDSPARARSGTETRARRSDTRTPRNRPTRCALRRSASEPRRNDPPARAMRAHSPARRRPRRPVLRPLPAPRPPRAEPSFPCRRRRPREQRAARASPRGSSSGRRGDGFDEGPRWGPFWSRSRRSGRPKSLALHDFHPYPPRQIDAAPNRPARVRAARRNCSAGGARVA